MSHAGSVMGDNPIMEGDDGRAATVTLPGDYIARLTAVAAIPQDSLFVMAAPTIPHSYMTTFRADYTNDMHPVLSGPVQTIVVGCTLVQEAANPGGAYAGVVDGKMAMAAITEVFLKDLGAAVNAAAAKYNRAIAQFAENANVPCCVQLNKAESYRSSANFRTRQDAIAALNLKLTGGVPIQEAYAIQCREPATFKLVRTDGDRSGSSKKSSRKASTSSNDYNN
jgi:hypothetical protein